MWFFVGFDCPPFFCALLRLEMTPTKNQLVKDGFSIGEEYELSLEVKFIGKVPGWTNIVHISNGGNCCGRGKNYCLHEFVS